jgi:hypothetical protein
VPTTPADLRAGGIETVRVLLTGPGRRVTAATRSGAGEDPR